MSKIPRILPAICIICILTIQLVLSSTHGSAHLLEELGIDITQTHENGPLTIAMTDTGPTGPEHDHDDPGHSHLCCDHHSPLYSLTNIAGLIPSFHTADIMASDPLTTLPSVYLERFIPPQNLA